MEDKKEKEEKKNVKKERKSNVVLVTVLIALLLAAFFGFGYAVGGAKVVEKVVENNKQEETVEPAKDHSNAKGFDLAKAKELLEEFGFNKPFGCGNYIYEKTYSDGYKTLTVLEKVKDSEKEMACSEFFSEEDVFEYDNSVYKGETGVCKKDGNTTAIAYEDANKVYKKMYGVDMPKKSANSLEFDSVYYVFYDYNKDKDMFVSLSCYGCGGACGPSVTINEIKTAKEVGNRVYIEVYYYHGKHDDLNGTQYHLETRKVALSFEANSHESAQQTIKDKYLDQLDVYQIEFEKQNDNYVFVKIVEKVD